MYPAVLGVPTAALSVASVLVKTTGEPVMLPSAGRMPIVLTLPGPLRYRFGKAHLGRWSSVWPGVPATPAKVGPVPPSIA